MTSRYVSRYELLLERGIFLSYVYIFIYIYIIIYVARRNAARAHLHSYLHNGSIFVLRVDGRRCEYSVLHELLQVLHIVVLRQLGVVVWPTVGAPPSPHQLARHLDAEQREFIVARVSYLFQQSTAGQRRA